MALETRRHAQFERRRRQSGVLIRPIEAKYLRFIFTANGPGISLPS
jgi:hypothetical protein